MQDSAAQTCPHGLRPGTTVCLHCRQDARNAARQRRYRNLTRAGLVTLGAATVVALIVGGIISLAPDGPASEVAAADSPASTVVVSSGTASRSDSAAPARPTLRPAIGEGRRELSEGMFAVREGPEVTVNFDSELLRTRFDWKFEGIVRTTLPVLFGDVARTALDSIATGALVKGGNLLTDLPVRGFPIALPEHTLRIWPVTRPGRDGPLVIGYRVRAE